MGVLGGSNVNPKGYKNYETFRSEEDKRKTSYLSFLTKERSKWDNFLKTESGQACAKIAEPMIKICDRIINADIVDMCKELNCSVEAARERKAMIIGERKVWLLILEEPGKLERLEKDLMNESKEKEDNKKK